MRPPYSTLINYAAGKPNEGKGGLSNLVRFEERGERGGSNRRFGIMGPSSKDRDLLSKGVINGEHS